MEVLVTTSEGVAQRYQFDPKQSVVLGRDDDCDLILRDVDVSRRHLQVQKAGEGWQLADTSSNGTYVGDTFLHQRTMRLNEESPLRVGPYTIRLLSTPKELNSCAPQARPKGEVGPASKEMTELRRQIHRKLLDNLELGNLQRNQISDEQMRPQVLQALRKLVAESQHSLLADLDLPNLIEELANEALGLGPLEGLLADDSVSEIMVVNPQLIYCERDGKIELTPYRFTDDDSARSAIERIVTPLGRRIDESTPFVDARLKDGSRVNAVIRPLALQGACITIRKFNANSLSIEDLVGFDSLSAPMARFLKRSVQARRNIVISGGTGSGKTTLLNVLSQSIPESERVVTIEDAAELQLVQDHVVSLESRPPNMEGRGEITIRDLVRNALRMRPDRILVGECRGGEAIDMLQAMNTGHDGSMTTTHANNPREAVRRLETLVLMSGIDLPSRAIREQIAGSVDLIVQQSRLSDGSRRVTSIVEVIGMGDDGQVEIEEIFHYNRTGTDEQGKAVGRYQATGFLPSYLDLMIRLGLVTGDDYL